MWSSSSTSRMRRAVTVASHLPMPSSTVRTAALAPHCQSGKQPTIAVRTLLRGWVWCGYARRGGRVRPERPRLPGRGAWRRSSPGRAAAKLTQGGQLLGRLDGDDLQAKGLAEGDDRPGQGGVAGAEVVQGQTHAELPQLGQDRDGRVQLLHDRGLGDLQHQTVWVQVGGVQRRSHLVYDAGVLELAGGEIDCDRQRRWPPTAAAMP